MKRAFVWIFLSGGLAAIAGLNWHLGTVSPDISPIESNANLTTETDPSVAGELDLKTVTMVQAKTRPLFEKSRRPWVAPLLQPDAVTPDVAAAQIDVALPEATIAQDPVDARLLGIQRTPAHSMVLIADGTGASGDWFKTGSKYRDWTISEVTSNSVKLESGGRTFVLEL
jgi:hypothetical protein